MNSNDRASDAPLDLLIRGGWVVDGTAYKATQRDVGVRDGRLVVRPGVGELTAGEVIDAAGLMVAPGFIDIHGHSDFNALMYPRADSKLLSGVTTEVSGNCGYGAFPLLGDVLDRRKSEYEHRGLKIDWQRPDEFFARADASPSSVNRIVLVGHENVRAGVMGYADARADDEQIRQMVELVAEGMKAGAWGLSTGLIYSPGCFADRRELIALARVAVEHGGYYASHIRGEGATVLEAVEEFMAIVSESGGFGQLSHVKVAGQQNWHLFEPLKERLHRAREEGVDFLADRYPYTASSTDLGSMVLPQWAVAGTLDERLARLSDADARRRIEREIAEEKAPDFAKRIMICDVQEPDQRDAMGKRLSEVAAARGTSVVQAAFDLLLGDRMRTTCVCFTMSDEHLEDTLKWPFVMIGSDGSIHDGIGAEHGPRCHPRSYGTPARTLGTYVRERGVLSWPEAVHKLSGLPAQALGLADRGRIADGLAADLVIFDPETVADRARYDCPALPPAGIEYVVVNGQIAARQGEHAGVYPGKLLRRS